MANICGRTIKLQDLAQQTGLSIGLLSMLFNGKRAPTVRNCQAISKALDVGIERLINEFQRRASALQ